MENKYEININENRYAKHRKAVKRISESENVDVATACAILRYEMGWKFGDGVDQEITEFTRYINSLDGGEIKAFFDAE